MSAFVVTNATVNAVCQAFGVDKYNAPRADEDLPALGQQLYEMNAAAVSQRYSEEPEPVQFNYEWKLQYSKGQQYLACCCLRYQCSEGDVPERPLYKQLVKVTDALAHEIARRDREVEASEWDIKEGRQELGMLLTDIAKHS